MNAKDVKVGMKVVPHDMTSHTHSKLDNSQEWKRAKQNGFMYVADIRGDTFLLNSRDVRGYDGDFFNAVDFSPALIGVGDTVRVTNVRHGGMPNGTEEVVTQIDNLGMDEDGFRFRYYGNHGKCYHDNEVTLVRKAKPAEKKEEAMSNRPELSEINEMTLVKTRGMGLAFVTKDGQGQCKPTNRELANGRDTLYLSGIYIGGDSKYGIIATKQCESQVNAIQHVMCNFEPESWDWQESDDKQEIKVGDWVEVVDSGSGKHSIGLETKIESVDRDGDFTAKGDDGKTWMICRSRLKPCAAPAQKKLTIDDITAMVKGPWILHAKDATVEGGL